MGRFFAEFASCLSEHAVSRRVIPFFQFACYFPGPTLLVLGKMMALIFFVIEDNSLKGTFSAVFEISNGDVALAVHRLSTKRFLGRPPWKASVTPAATSLVPHKALSATIAQFVVLNESSFVQFGTSAMSDVLSAPSASP